MADYSTAPSLNLGSASTNYAKRLANRQESERLAQPFQRVLTELVACYLEDPSVLAATDSASSASRFLQELPDEKKQILQKKLGGNFLFELGSLAKDLNPEMQAQGLLNLGIRFVQAQRIEAAALLFAQLENFLQNSDSAWAKPMGEQVRGELEALEGQGSSARRFEFNLLGLSQSVLDPGLIGGLIAGSLVGQTVRLMGLTRIFGVNGMFALSSPWAIRSLASGLAFGAEIPAVLATTKGIHAALGKPQSWKSADLGKEALDLGLNLLLFRAMHWAGSETFARFHQFSTLPELQASFHPLTRVSAGVFPYATAFLGVFTAQKVESLLGLKPAAPNDTLLVDALSGSLVLTVGGELGNAALGAKWFSQLRAVEIALHSKGGKDFPGASGFNEKLGKLAALLFPQVRRPALALGPVGEFEQPFLSVIYDGKGVAATTGSGSAGSIGPQSFVARRFGQRLKADLIKRWQLAETDAVLERIVANFGNTRFSLDPQRMQANYYKLLSLSQPKVPDLIRDEFTTPKDLLEQATQVFADLSQRDPFRTVTGTLYDHYLQYGLEQTLLAENDVAFDRLVEIVTRERTLQGLENFLRNFEPEKNFSLQPSTVNLRQLNHRRWFDRLIALKVPRPVFTQVFDYLEATIPTLGSASKPLKKSDYNFVTFRASDGRSLDSAMSGEVALKSLERFVNLHGTDSEEFDLLVGALQKAHESKVPYLTMDRIFKILATDNIEEKLREIAHWEEFDWRKLGQLLVLAREKNDYKDGASRINGTVYTGYVKDLDYAEQLAYLYNDVESFLRPGNLSRHRQMIVYRASELLKPQEAELKRTGKRPESATLTAEDVPEMLYHGMTPLALKARKAILSGEVQLLVLPRKGELMVENADSLKRARHEVEDADTPEEKFKVLGKMGMEDLWRFLDHPDREKEAPNAYFVPAGNNPAGKPLIVVTEIARNLSREAKTHSAVFLSGHVVHEFKHYLDHKDLDFSNRDDLLKAELRGHGGYHYFLLQQGVPGPWERMNLLTGHGFGMWQRSLLDWEYLNVP